MQRKARRYICATFLIRSKYVSDEAKKKPEVIEIFYDIWHTDLYGSLLMSLTTVQVQ